MTDKNHIELSAFLLRISLGVMFIAHSLYLKLLIFTLPGTAQSFVGLGLPGILAYIVFAIEAVAGIMLVLGVQSRWAALVTIPILMGATWAHWGNGWMFGYENGGWEYPLYLTLLAFVQFLLGDGVLALKPSSPIPSTQVTQGVN